MNSELYLKDKRRPKTNLPFYQQSKNLKYSQDAQIKENHEI